MSDDKQLGPQVKNLLSSLSGHGVLHLIEVETDLMQTSALLVEAIDKLAASFMAIHEAVGAHQAEVERLLSGGDTSVALPESLKAHQAEIARHVNAAVTGLQFQDMTDQLLGRIVQRVAGLREVLDGIGSGCAEISEKDAQEIVTALTGINDVLKAQSEKLESALRKTSVLQTHMESGDIELF